MTRHPTRFSAKFCRNRPVLRMIILINFQAWWWSTFFNTLGKGRGSTLGQCYTPKSGSADRSWRGEPGISMFPDVSVRTDWESSVMSGVSELALHVFDKFVFNNLLINQTSLPNHSRILPRYRAQRRSRPPSHTFYPRNLAVLWGHHLTIVRAKFHAS